MTNEAKLESESFPRERSSTLRFSNPRTRNGESKVSLIVCNSAVSFHIIPILLLRSTSASASHFVRLIARRYSSQNHAFPWCRNPVCEPHLSKTLKLQQERSAKAGGEACSVNNIWKRLATFSDERDADWIRVYRSHPCTRNPSHVGRR